MFDVNTILNLKAYVYMLIDPNTNVPFYIGKGSGNRLFDHINLALTDIDAVTAKYETIRRIQNAGLAVKHIIVRHGLTDAEAFHIEASMIDVIEYLGTPLTNIKGGHNSIDKGLMTVDEIIRLYNAEPLTQLGADCVIININQKYPKKKLVEKDSISSEILKATEGIWTMNKRRVFDKQGGQKINYVLSEYRGLIVEVFEVMKWDTKKRGYSNKDAIKYGQEKDGFVFKGKIAQESIRSLYLNKSIAHIKVRGSATAIRYTLEPSKVARKK